MNNISENHPSLTIIRYNSDILHFPEDNSKISLPEKNPNSAAETNTHNKQFLKQFPEI